MLWVDAHSTQKCSPAHRRNGERGGDAAGSPSAAIPVLRVALALANSLSTHAAALAIGSGNLQFESAPLTALPLRIACIWGQKRCAE